MSWKLNLINIAFPKTLLKKHKISKQKNKIFIIYSNSTKLNWLLFRNIITSSRYHFNLEPILYVTDAMGFQDVYSRLEMNPYNPTFNILSKVDLDMTRETIVHNDIIGITYTLWWDWLDIIDEVRKNYLLFTNNFNELQKILEKVKKKNFQIVIFNLISNKEKDQISSKINVKEIWNIKYNHKLLKEWEDLSLFKIINQKIDIRKHRKLKMLRNKIFLIMNEYYLSPIVPSHYSDEDKYEKNTFEEAEIIKNVYE